MIPGQRSEMYTDDDMDNKEVMSLLTIKKKPKNIL